MVLLLCTLLVQDADADRARAILALAAAAAQAQRVWPVPSFERLSAMPTALEAAPNLPKKPLTLEQAAALAAKLKKPLVLWVGGYENAELRAQIDYNLYHQVVHVRVETWKGSAEPGIVAAPLHQGWPHARRLIPAAEADASTVTRELVGEWLRPTRAGASVPVQPSPPLLAPARGRSC